MITVALVDDQAVVRAGLRTLLGPEADITVVGEAADGESALAMVATTQPDVVLMDIQMPGLDGISATAVIAADPSHSRVCVLTTYGLDEYVYDALAAGASGFLLKTDTPERIIATVRSIAAGEFALGTETTASLISRFLESGPQDRPDAEQLDRLTPRELEVFLLLAEGLSNNEIAQRLFVGEGTVKTHVTRILMKLGLRDRVQAVVLAARNGMIGRR